MFLTETMFILKVIKFHFKGSYDKQNLNLVVISYKMTMSVRSSINPIFIVFLLFFYLSALNFGHSHLQ